MSITDPAGCSATRHGTHVAYLRHGCRCPDALRAKRGYIKRLQLGIQPVAEVSTVGPQRRIRALQTLGYSRKRLAEYLGYAAPSPASLSPVFWRNRIRRELAEHIAQLYERLCMTPGPSERTRLRARSTGYASPLAWEGHNLDDPTDEPDVDTATSGNADDEIDKIAVARATSGTLPAAKLRKPERLAAVAALVDAKVPSNEIARRLDYNRKQVDRDRTALKIQRCRDRQHGEVSP